MIAHIYEEGVLQGKLKDGHSMAHADIMWGIFTGLLMWEESKRRLNPKKDFLKPTLDKAFDIFVEGIRERSIIYLHEVRSNDLHEVTIY